MDFQLRDAYNPQVVREQAKRIKKVYPKFDEKGFVNFIVPKLAALNFGAREKLITEGLTKFLPKKFKHAARILVDSLQPELKETELTGFEGFITVPMGMYISKHGLNDFDTSMTALKEITKRFSSEGPVRAFISKYPKKSIQLFEKWAMDKNVHVRRLVSEGTRPRLPLCSPLRQYIKDPNPILHLLDMLKEDPELYVRRSVANNLNDISKDNPDVVVALLRNWKKVENQGTQWLIKHSLRTLFKRGHKGALELMGFMAPKVELTEMKVTPKIKIGEILKFSVSINSLQKQKLMIDYAIHYVKANGKHAAKVFKLAIKNHKGELTFTKKHAMHQMTTRKHYPGVHILEIIVNGKRLGKKEFTLTTGRVTNNINVYTSALTKVEAHEEDGV